MKICCSLAALALTMPCLFAQAGGAKSGADWPMYNRDPAGTRYSPLTQINTKNVANLKLAWSFQLKADATKPGPQSEATPIMVNGVMYLPAGNRIVALKPETGELLWQYVIAEGVPQRRGVTY